MDDVCQDLPLRNSPRIAALVSEASTQYFILIEQTVFCQVPSFQYALFLGFCAYYIFNLSYPKQTQKVLYFFQDYILGMPDSAKRPAVYLAIAADINRFVDSNFNTHHE